MIALMIVLLAAAPWKFPPDSADIVVKHEARPLQTNVGGITFVGEMVVFSHPVDPAIPEIDSFVVELPDTARALCVLVVGGVPLPLRTVRDLKIPPWVPGDDVKLGLPTLPVVPGIAWRSFMYHADTLVMWGYDAGDSIYVGHLQMRTSIKVRPDSNAVFAGYWRSHGQAVPIVEIAAVPVVRNLRQKYEKQIDRFALRQQR